eukprot:COSAG01_NODE_271_length_19794_cov_73.630890_7_plen_76_part_00
MQTSLLYEHAIKTSLLYDQISSAVTTAVLSTGTAVLVLSIYFEYYYRGFRANYTMDSHCGPLCFSESGLLTPTVD